MKSHYQGCPGCLKHSLAARAGFRPGRGRLQVIAAVKKRPLKTVVCSKTLVAKEKCLEKLIKECRSVADYATEEMKDRENGILEFEVFQDPFEEQKIHFMEKYEDNVKMGRFNSKDRFQKFMADVQKYIEKPVGMALYEWDRGTLGSACVQGGPKGEGGLDDATGASGMASGANYQQTSRVVNLGNLEKDEKKATWGLDFKFPWQQDDKK